jgi:hypothetical protein
LTNKAAKGKKGTYMILELKLSHSYYRKNTA